VVGYLSQSYRCEIKSVLGSWNQPVLSNKGNISCTRKQQLVLQWVLYLSMQIIICHKVEICGQYVRYDYIDILH